MSPILDLQLRFRELGRIRMGEKGPKGEPRRLDRFRLTSPNRGLLDHAADLYGGTVREWKDAPTPGQYELMTGAAVLPIAIPPGPEPVSQWYEQWKTSGCTHRCDGVTNMIDDTPCACDPDDRECKATTRVNVIIPDLPDVGVWRLESHGWNAAIELPGTIQLIRQASARSVMLTGRLRLDHRVRKAAGETRRFIVPVIDLDVTINQLTSGDIPRPALTAGGANLPESTQATPTVPAVTPSADGQSSPSAEGEKTITDAQRRRLFKLAGDHGVTRDEVREIVAKYRGDGSDSTDMPVTVYDLVITDITTRPKAA